jgi:hypothetical protein
MNQVSPSKSKAPSTKVPPPPMSFPQAMEEVIKGNKVTKQEWNNKEIYGAMIDGKLKIKLADGKFHDWIITDGDLMGNDFMVL